MAVTMKKDCFYPSSKRTAIQLLELEDEILKQRTIWMRAVWNELSSQIIKHCEQHTKLSEKHVDVEPLIDLIPSRMHTDEELGEIENAIAQLVPAR